MGDQAVVKQGTIICQGCGKEIDADKNTNGVKTWYGICIDCADKKEKKK